MSFQPTKAQMDAQDIAIAEKMKQQQEKLKKYAAKAKEGLKLLQTLEGLTDEISFIVDRMRTLAEQVVSGEYSEEECGYRQEEVAQLQAEIDRLSSDPAFRTIKSGLSSAGEATIQIGEDGAESLSFPYRELGCAALGVDASKVNVSTPENATKALANLDAALELLKEQRGTVGAVQNRLEHFVNSEEEIE